MTQTQLKLRTGKAEAERIFSILDAEFEDDGYGIAITEIDEDADIHEVSLYIETDDALIESTTKRMVDRLGSDGFGLDITREDLPDIDWVAKSLEGLKPVRAGRFLVHGEHDRDQVRSTDIGIQINAGQAFGTGHHGTTSGCLIMLESLLRRTSPQNCLDLGTGSAVLAIAVAKLAHLPVLATDIDPVAIKVARENVLLNGEKRAIRCETAIGFHHLCFHQEAPFDLIIANILPWPLMAMARQIERHLAYDGDVVLSGILVSQRAMVLAKFRDMGLVHKRTIEREGWVTIHLKRK